MIRTDILERKEDILKWIAEGQSKAYMTRQLRCKNDTLTSYLKKMGIEYGGNKSGKGVKMSKYKKSLLEYIETDNPKTHKIRLKMLEEGYKEHKCEVCGLSEWNGESIPLELHHIDGDRFNNKLNNLQMICPNCHAQTDNHAGKNKGHKKPKVE